VPTHASSRQNDRTTQPISPCQVTRRARLPSRASPNPLAARGKGDDAHSAPSPACPHAARPQPPTSASAWQDVDRLVPCHRRVAPWTPVRLLGGPLDRRRRSARPRSRGAADADPSGPPARHGPGRPALGHHAGHRLRRRRGAPPAPAGDRRRRRPADLA
jgi:hypothetical protein